MRHSYLPSRRDEGWRWSDLRAAVNDVGVPEFDPVGEGHIADRLTRGWAALDSSRQLDAEPAIATLSISGAETLVDDLNLDDGFEWHSEVLIVEEGADVTRIVRQAPIQNEDGAFGVGVWLTHVHVKRGGRFRQFILSEGGNLVRIETHIDVEGEGAHVELNGVYMAGAGRHADLTSVINHHVAQGETRQLIKGVARKGGRGVFQGKIVVAKHAQKTDARQYHHGMLLEEGAEIFAKPELMIHADDVQCAHGNTAGGLDERALFYMRSRGVPQAEARALLIESFLVEAIPTGLPEDLHNELVDRIRAWLARGAA